MCICIEVSVFITNIPTSFYVETAPLWWTMQFLLVIKSPRKESGESKNLLFIFSAIDWMYRQDRGRYLQKEEKQRFLS